jgi:hypothetical protein
MKNYQISLVTEIPPSLHLSLQKYLNSHPDYDQDKVFTEALSRFFREQEKIKNEHSSVTI